MNRYERAKIYKIECNVTGKCYIGSTCEPTLAKRLAKHVGNYRDYTILGKGNYVTSYEILENNDYDIVLIEDYHCERKDQLLSRERYHIERTECVNKVKRPGAQTEAGGRKKI